MLGVCAGELIPFGPQRVTIISIAGLYLALFGSAVASTAYLWLLDRMPASLVATYTFVNPVIALLLGWLVLKEQLTVIERYERGYFFASRTASSAGFATYRQLT